MSESNGNKGNENIKESSIKLVDNELTRTYYQNFHLQNYAAKLYQDNNNMLNELKIVKDNNISLQNSLLEKDDALIEKDHEINYLQDTVELFESDVRKLEKEINKLVAEKTKKRKRLPDELELPKPQKKKIEPTEISYSKDQIKTLFKNINSIDDIINLPEEKYINHNNLMNKLLKLREPLRKLKEMIGLQNIKEEIFKHIIYFIMNEQELQHQPGAAHRSCTTSR